MYKLKDVKDKILDGGNDLAMAVVKATNREIVVPKLKHERTIFMMLDSNESSRLDCLKLLVQRTRSKDWIVVMKSLLILHKVLRNPVARDMLQDEYPHLFASLSNFSDFRSVFTIDQSKIIVKYAAYLEEKIHESTTNSSADVNIPVSQLKIDKLLSSLPELQQRLSAALNMISPLSNALEIPPPTRLVFVYILKDSLVLYKSVSERILRLLDEIPSLTKEQCESLVQLYKVYARQTKMLEDLWNLFADDSTDHIQLNSDSALQILPALEARIVSLSANNGSGSFTDLGDLGVSADSTSTSIVRNNNNVSSVSMRQKMSGKGKGDNEDEGLAVELDLDLRIEGGLIVDGESNTEAKAGSKDSNTAQGVPPAAQTTGEADLLGLGLDIDAGAGVGVASAVDISDNSDPFGVESVFKYYILNGFKLEQFSIKGQVLRLQSTLYTAKVVSDLLGNDSIHYPRFFWSCITLLRLDINNKNIIDGWVIYDLICDLILSLLKNQVSIDSVSDKFTAVSEMWTPSYKGLQPLLMQILTQSSQTIPTQSIDKTLELIGVCQFYPDVLRNIEIGGDNWDIGLIGSLLPWIHYQIKNINSGETNTHLKQFFGQLAKAIRENSSIDPAGLERDWSGTQEDADEFLRIICEGMIPSMVQNPQRAAQFAAIWIRQWNFGDNCHQKALLLAAKTFIANPDAKPFLDPNFIPVISTAVDVFSTNQSGLKDTSFDIVMLSDRCGITIQQNTLSIPCEQGPGGNLFGDVHTALKTLEKL